MLDRLTLDQLRVFVTVVEAGSFSAAARRLSRVQSAISQSIQSLEATLGMLLFDRSGRVPVLNEPGRVMLADAQRVLREAEALRDRAEEIVGGHEPSLSLAVDVFFPNAVLAESLRGLTGMCSRLPITLYTEAMGAAEQRLRDGTVRLAIMAARPGSTAGLVLDHLVAVPMIAVAAAGHPLAQAVLNGGAADGGDHVQLVLTDRSDLSEGQEFGVRSNRVWRFADQATRRHFLLAGFGWCHMPRHEVFEDIAAGRLVALPPVADQQEALPLYVGHLAGRGPGRAGRWLIEDLRQRVRSCVGHHGTGKPPIPAVEQIEIGEAAE